MKYHKYTTGEAATVVLPMFFALVIGGFRLLLSLDLLPWTMGTEMLPILLISDLILLADLLYWCISLSALMLRPGSKGAMTFVGVLSFLVVAACLYHQLFSLALFTDHLYAALPLLPVCINCIVTVLLLTGAIPGNSLWPELISRSTLPLLVTDSLGDVRYDTRHALPLSAAQKKAVVSNRGRGNSFADRDSMLVSVPVKNGFFVEKRDLRDLHTLQSELDELQKQLQADKEILLRRNDAPAELLVLRQSPEKYLAYCEPVAALLDNAAELLIKSTEAEAIPGRTLLGRAKLYIACAEGYGSLYEHRAQDMSLSYFGGVLENPIRHACCSSLNASVRSIARGICPFRAMIGLYRALAELILTAGEKHWSELAIRMRNDSDTLRCFCSITGADPEELISMAQVYYDYLTPEYGKIGIGTENGKNTLYFTVYHRAETDEIAPAIPEADMHELMNLHAGSVEKTIQLLEKEVAAICNTATPSL